MKTITLKRKGILLGLLLCVLAAATYVGGRMGLSPADEITRTVETGKTLGQATAVSGSDAPAADGYFEEAKLTRQQTRDEAIELLKSVVENEMSDETTIQQALAQMTTIAERIETEGRIENMVKAKGFADCLAYIEDDRATLTVSGTITDEGQAAQLQEIALTETDLPVEQIKINQLGD